MVLLLIVLVSLSLSFIFLPGFGIGTIVRFILFIVYIVLFCFIFRESSINIKNDNQYDIKYEKYDVLEYRAKVQENNTFVRTTNGEEFTFSRSGKVMKGKKNELIVKQYIRKKNSLEHILIYPLDEFTKYELKIK